MFRIMGANKSQPNRLRSLEEIDCAESKEDAEFLKNEYQMAFGSSWTIWVEKKRSNLSRQVSSEFHHVGSLYRR